MYMLTSIQISKFMYKIKQVDKFNIDETIELKKTYSINFLLPLKLIFEILYFLCDFFFVVIYR